MRFLLLFFPFFLFSLNLSEILTYPKSYVRDFYLTQFMGETNSTILAYKAYNSMYRKKPFKHLRILAKKSVFFSEIYRCVNVKPSYLRDVDIACILNNGLSLRSISKLPLKDLVYLYNNLPDSKEKKAVNVFLSNDFSSVFLDRDLGYYFILNYPKKEIDQSIKDFSIFEDGYFHLFVKSAVVNRLVKIQNSLLKLDFKDFNDKVKWWLFLNAMSLKKYDLAKRVLYSIKAKSSRIDFWKWQLGDKKGFENLVKNPRVDFYTLYAHEEANKDFFIRRKIIYNTSEPKYDQRNPWDVLKFFDEFKKTKDLFSFAKQLDNNKSMALKALVLDKAFHYKQNFFITPKMYEDKNASFKAFVYAIARQESRFIPASVSRSYALGTMQIMPFLIKHYKGDVFRQFDYTQNIKLGVKHLKWLFSKLKDPLMVAYAYNGGIGFVSRKVIPYFHYKGEFEPFLSMELVPYDESREYGKKVIANYVIYHQMFGGEENLHKLINK
ncbi:MAG: transglycosylase SLT domain-containing protein [Nautiliaceae bacterium]